MEQLGNAPVGARVRLSSGTEVLVGRAEGGLRWVHAQGGPEVSMAGSTPCEFLGEGYAELRALLALSPSAIRARLPTMPHADLERLATMGPPMWLAHEIKLALAGRTSGAEMAPATTVSSTARVTCLVCQAIVVPVATPRGLSTPAHPGREAGVYCTGSGQLLEPPPTTTPAPTKKRAKPELATLAGWSENITGTPPAEPSTPDEVATAQAGLAAAREVGRQQGAHRQGRRAPSQAPAAQPVDTTPEPIPAPVAAPVEVVVEQAVPAAPLWSDGLHPMETPPAAPLPGRHARLFDALQLAVHEAELAGVGITLSLTIPPRIP